MSVWPWARARAPTNNEPAKMAPIAKLRPTGRSGCNNIGEDLGSAWIDATDCAVYPNCVACQYAALATDGIQSDDLPAGPKGIPPNCRPPGRSSNAVDRATRCLGI